MATIYAILFLLLSANDGFEITVKGNGVRDLDKEAHELCCRYEVCSVRDLLYALYSERPAYRALMDFVNTWLPGPKTSNNTRNT